MTHNEDWITKKFDFSFPVTRSLEFLGFLFMPNITAITWRGSKNSKPYGAAIDSAAPKTISL
jgi:hypothetical protein